MTPLKLKLILHFHSSTEPYYKEEIESKEYRSIIRELFEEEMITEYWNTEDDSVNAIPGVFQLTAKGDVFVNALMTVPLPTLQYVMIYPN